MFGSLKDKLKKWVSKNEEEEEIIEEAPKKTAKKKKSVKKKTEKKKTTPKKTKKKKTAEKEEIKKKTASGKTEEKETKTKSTEPNKEEESEKKESLFSKLKKKITSEEEEEEIEEESEEKETEQEIKEEEPKQKKSIFSKFQKTLDEEKFEELFSELQIILLQNNVAYEAVETIEESLKKSLIGKPMKQISLSEELKSAIESLLINPPNFLDKIKSSESKPFIILFAGINGSGKTTTIAKVASHLQKNNLSVCLAAADTFRAAAIQQLEEHGNNLKIPTIKKDYGADPASVGFDAVKYARKHNLDVVLIDTAGRMQNSDTLMKEIEKIERVTKPDMKIFLGESTTGNDATLQAKAFNDSIGLTGIILSKADVDESGGTAISVSYVAKVPILFLGTGQNYEDLETFNKEKLIEKLGL